MRVISWNVNGIRAVNKKNINGETCSPNENNCICELNDKYNPDILVLQEIKTQSFIDLEEYRQIFPYIAANTAEKKGYSGVAILSKHPPLATNTGFYHCQMKDAQERTYSREGRLITVEFEKIIIVGTYVPNSKIGLTRLDERGQWETDIKMHLSLTKIKSHGKPVIYCGDLNVAHQDIDICNPKTNKKSAGFSIKECNWFTDLLNAGWVDTYRFLNPNTVKYSWWSPITRGRSRNVGWRIDYVLLDKDHHNILQSADILNDVFGSDHCPVMADLNV